MLQDGASGALPSPVLLRYGSRQALQGLWGTQRLCLRPPAEGDLEALYALHTDPAANRFNPAEPLNSLDDAHGLLQRWRAHWQLYGFGYWAVATQAQPEQLLGIGGLMHRRIDGQESLNLYFRFRPQAWGQGYACETGRAALALAFEQLHEEEVLSVVRPSNLPSRRLLERIGMRLSGAWGDVPGQPASLIYEMNAGSYAVLGQMADPRLIQRPLR